MIHDYHHVGIGRIWCCSRCGFSVEVMVSERPDAGPKADLPCKDDDSFWHLLQMERRQ